MLRTRKAVAWMIATASFVAFAACVTFGSSLPTACGTVPCSPGEIVRAASNSVASLDYYIVGLAVLLAGEASVAIMLLTSRPGNPLKS